MNCRLIYRLIPYPFVSFEEEEKSKRRGFLGDGTFGDGKVVGAKKNY